MTIEWTKEVPQKEGRYWTSHLWMREPHVDLYQCKYPGHRTLRHDENTYYSKEPADIPEPPAEDPQP